MVGSSSGNKNAKRKKKKGTNSTRGADKARFPELTRRYTPTRLGHLALAKEERFIAGCCAGCRLPIDDCRAFFRSFVRNGSFVVVVVVKIGSAHWKFTYGDWNEERKEKKKNVQVMQIFRKKKQTKTKMLGAHK